MSFIEIYSLNGCIFSIKAENLLKEHGLKYKVIKVSQSEKEKYKLKNKMKTFPQIFIIENTSKINVGGSDILLDLINISHILKYNEINLNKLNKFYKIFKKK
jgi:glutaredoxin